MEEMEYMTEDREFTIETPVGSITSDSGNHVVDIVSVMGAIIVLYVVKKIVSKYLWIWMVKVLNKELDGQKSLKKTIKKYLKRKIGAKNETIYKW